MNRRLLKLTALASMAVIGAAASAFMVDDARILIDRALNSPTLTIKYTGASAAMAELRLNGISLGTRELNATRQTGETNFTIDLTTLKDGDNEVEIRLYDKDGKLVGSEKTTITSEEGARGPIYVVGPKVGSTVQGPVEIKVGFGRELSNKYVSFFVNNQFRSMTNTAPFAYTWDTTREPNGWHELEAWVVDDQGNTFKTRKVKVFVNNPSGRTNRVNTPAPQPAMPLKTVPSVPTPKPTAAGGIRTSNATSAAVNTVPAATAPAATRVTSSSPIPAVVTATNSLKPITTAAVQMGSRTSTPTVTGASKPVTVPAVETPRPKPVIDINPTGSNSVNSITSSGRISITRGTRLPNAAPLTILMGGTPMKFDVAPRVQEGIPLTPFRHLFEANGGKVDWDNLSKIISATKEGSDVWMKIGDRMAKVNKIDVELEMAPFVERGRTIVPLSFIRESLQVEVEYDPKTGHVLIRKAK
jgi:hypothetical protein